jgi:cytochrome b
MSNRIRVWDLPTRLFHWALVACIVGSVITGYVGGPTMEWHARIGYVVLTLLLFRIVWGFTGGRWSRFASFLYSPGAVVSYLRGKPHPDHLVGHNPLGAGAVFAMLIFLLAQVATGLIGDDETAFTGPLNKFVSNAKGLTATWYHKRVGQWVIAALIVAHIAAVLYYLWKKQQNLVKPMLVGDKEVPTATLPSRDDAISRMAALGVLVMCAGFVAWVVQLGN